MKKRSEVGVAQSAVQTARGQFAMRIAKQFAKQTAEHTEGARPPARPEVLLLSATTVLVHE